MQGREHERRCPIRWQSKATHPPLHCASLGCASCLSETGFVAPKPSDVHERCAKRWQNKSSSPRRKRRLKEHAPARARRGARPARAPQRPAHALKKSPSRTRRPWVAAAVPSSSRAPASARWPSSSLAPGRSVAAAAVAAVAAAVCTVAAPAARCPVARHTVPGWGRDRGRLAGTAGAGSRRLRLPAARPVQQRFAMEGGRACERRGERGPAARKCVRAPGGRRAHSRRRPGEGTRRGAPAGAQRSTAQRAQRAWRQARRQPLQGSAAHVRIAVKAE